MKKLIWIFRSYETSTRTTIKMQQSEANQIAALFNRQSEFKTTADHSKERTMCEVVKAPLPSGAYDTDLWRNKWAEEYDRAAWYEARADCLQKLVWRLQAEMQEVKKAHEEECHMMYVIGRQAEAEERKKKRS